MKIFKLRYNNTFSCFLFLIFYICFTSINVNTITKIWFIGKSNIKNDVAITNDHKLFAVTYGHEYHLWDYETKEIIDHIFFPDQATGMMVSPNGKMVMINTVDRRILKNIETRQIIAIINEGRLYRQFMLKTTYFSHDKRFVLTDQHQDNTVKMWDTETGELVKSFGPHPSMVRSAAFSEDDQFIFAVTIDSNISVF